MSTKVDPFTSERFQPKRRNQKFACRKNQVDYNNQKAFQFRLAQGEGPKKLLVSYKALHTLLGEKNERVCNINFLQGKGVDTGYFTSYERNKEDKGIYHVFNIKMENIDNKNFKIYR